MFCPKCGAQIPDGSAFCPTCGEQFNAQPQEQPAPAPQQPAKAPAFAVPPVKTLVKLGIALLAFIFGFLPWFSIGASYFGISYSESFSILTGSMFSLSVILGFAKIFMIIAIIVFFVHVAAQLVDFNKFVKLPIKVSEVSPLCYFGLYDLALLLNLIGSFTAAAGEEGISSHPAVCWFFALIFGVCGTLVTLKPDLLDKVIPAKKQ